MSFLSSSQIRNLARAVNPAPDVVVEPGEAATVDPSVSIRALLQDQPAREPDFPHQAANDVADDLTDNVADELADDAADVVANDVAADHGGESVPEISARDNGLPQSRLLGDDYGQDVANRLFASMHNADKARVVRLEAMRKGFLASKKEWTMRQVAVAQLRDDVSVVRREAAQNLLDGAAYYKDYFQGQLDYLYANPIDHSQGRRTAMDYAAKMMGKSRDDVRQMFADYVARMGLADRGLA